MVMTREEEDAYLFKNEWVPIRKNNWGTWSSFINKWTSTRFARQDAIAMQRRIDYGHAEKVQCSQCGQKFIEAINKDRTYMACARCRIKLRKMEDETEKLVSLNPGIPRKVKEWLDTKGEKSASLAAKKVLIKAYEDEKALEKTSETEAG